MQTNVALRAILFAAALASSICIRPTLGLAADPALRSTEVVTPCGGTVQIPGVGEPGKTGCSGNFSTAFEVGNLTVTYNSQFEEYNPSQPSLAPSSGFGRGMRALGELVGHMVPGYFEIQERAQSCGGIISSVEGLLVS